MINKSEIEKLFQFFEKSGEYKIHHRLAKWIIVSV